MPKLDPSKTTPFGMWRYGSEFLIAADFVANKTDVSRFMPYFFLLGQSIELSLKAFLLAQETSLEELRDKLRHDLKKLVTRAEDKNLGEVVQINQVERGVIEVLNLGYKDRRFQYIETGEMLLPHIQMTDEIARKLSQKLKECCYQATFNKGT